MTRPGFRKGRPGGTPRPHDPADQGDGFVSTSLFSQAQILHLMKNEFARARRHAVPLGCIVIQVDRLAQLVDLHGVELRAVVRNAVGRLVREKTRGADLLGVTNEDRYLLVLPHTNLAQTRIVALRLHQMFGDYEIGVDGRQLALSLSIGITASGEHQAMFFDTLVAQAEAAVEFAMGEGGNRVVSFGETTLRGGRPSDGLSGGPSDGLPEPRGRRAEDRRDQGAKE